MRFFRVLSCFFIIAIVLCSVACSNPSKPVKAAGVKADEERKAAPEFSLKDADGRTVKLSDYAGKVVLLDLCATWCGPCKIEVPWLVEFERKYKDRGFAVIGVSMDEDGWESVKPFASRMGMNYRTVLGDDSVAQSYGGVEALPTTFLIDQSGRIASVHVGLANKTEIENGIEHLLQSGVARSARVVATPASTARAN